MEKLSDHSSYEWISNSVLSQADFVKAKGTRVGHCVPPCFERYAKILHPIYRNDSARVGETWNDIRPGRSLFDRLKSLIGRGDPLVDILQSATVMGMGAGIDDRDNRVMWREVADNLGVVFHPEINVQSISTTVNGSWPSQYYYPDEGYLGPVCTERLTGILATHTDPQPCYFLYDVITGHDENFDSDTLYQGDLVDMPGWLKLHDGGTPTVWWPSDQSWCVHCDEDLPFTLVGGSPELIDAILSDDLLEAIEVNIDHRVDYLADVINVEGAQAARDREPDEPVVPDPADVGATVTVERALDVWKRRGFTVQICETTPDSTFISNSEIDDDDEAIVFCTVYRNVKAARKSADRGEKQVANSVCSLFDGVVAADRKQHWKHQFAAAIKELRMSARD